MIVNAGKFHAIILDKHQGNHANQIINIDQKEIEVEIEEIEEIKS